MLNQQEKRYIRANRFEEVLARRLIVSTILSMNNPDVTTKLPWHQDVYDRFKIPSVEDSKKLLLEYTEAMPDDPIFIVVGVDEVQKLNKMMPDVEGDGLGRVFLRTLREWEREWYHHGVRIAPLGTGISLDWTVDTTEGCNMPLKGDDATLISKDDFHDLAKEVVDGLDEGKWPDLFPTNTTRETGVELLTAAYWPRVRLLEWWRDGKKDNLKQPKRDSERKNWLEWMSRWLRNEQISCRETTLIPGKSDKDGNIHCLFELFDDQNFYVIPDGYNLPFIIDVLDRELPVPHLYEGLNVIQQMDPKEFLKRDWYKFETFGFHVMSLAIHLGLYAFGTAPLPIQIAEPTPLQRERLGLALWFRDQNVSFRNENGEMLTPLLVGNSTTGSNQAAYYRFADSSQRVFNPKLLEILEQAKLDHFPVHLKCGKQTCCDCMYFYVRSTVTCGIEFLVTIVDAKHTAKDQGGGNSEGVTSNNSK